MRESRGSWWEGVSGSGANQNSLYITEILKELIKLVFKRSSKS